MCAGSPNFDILFCLHSAPGIVSARGNSGSWDTWRANYELRHKTKDAGSIGPANATVQYVYVTCVIKARTTCTRECKAWPPEKFMALEIVWRNPLPPPRTESRVEQLVLDEFGALYVIAYQGRLVSFELILGGAA